MTTPLLRRWNGFARYPFGVRLFSIVLGKTVPYTGTLGATVETLAPGYARASIRDRRSVRNHLRSIHAAALFGLGEVVGNMALSTLQPAMGRWIVAGMDIEYRKKARGRIVAECRLAPVDWTTDGDVTGDVALTDSTGDAVALLRARWKTGPAKTGQVS